MSRRQIVPALALATAVLALGFLVHWSRAESARGEQTFWYCVAVSENECAEPYRYFGSSPLPPARLMERVINKDAIELGDLRLYQHDRENDQWTAMPWSEYDPAVKDYIYFRPERVVAIHPLAGDPLQTKRPADRPPGRPSEPAK